MPKFSKILCIAFIPLLIIGCSESRIGRLDSLSVYKNESAEESVANPAKGYTLITELRYNLSEIKITESSRYSYVEGDVKNAKSLRRDVSQAIQSGLEKKDYRFVMEILNRMYSREGDFVGYDNGPSTNEKLLQMYWDISISKDEGKWPLDGVKELVNTVGTELLRQKKFITAYRLYGDAALGWEPLRDNNAEKVRGILFHFGCQQDIAVWGEFSSTTPWNNISGEAYPLIKMDEDFNLALARKNINTSRTAPDLQKSCPINLYD